MREETVVLIVVLVVFFLLTMVVIAPYICCCFALSFKRRNATFVELEDSEQTSYYSYDCIFCYLICSKTLTESEFVSVNNVQKRNQNYGSESITKNDVCAICFENLDEEHTSVTLKCNHGYHRRCIRKWLIEKNEAPCPLCHSNIEAKISILGLMTKASGV